MGTQDRAPAFQFYPKDWLSDTKVRALDPDERGRYIDLLCYMWEYGTEGCWIPRKHAEKLLGKVFIKAITSEIIATLDRDGEEWLYSDRLFQEAQKCESRRRRAQAAAAIRHGGSSNA